DVVLIEEWFERAPKIGLDAGSERAKLAAKVEDDEGVSRAAVPAGTGPGAANRFLNRPAGRVLARLGSKAPAPPTVQISRPQPAAAETGAAPAVPQPPVPQPPAPEAPAPEAPAPEPGPGEREQLADALRKVLTAVADGIEQPAAIGEKTGFSVRHVGNLLTRLREQGLIDREGNGKAVRYFLTEAGRRVA
ncbi:MAG TPA: hypothetical protein VGL02_32910, partial [Streptomyces sp.]